jgi:hypothetical protein
MKRVGRTEADELDNQFGAEHTTEPLNSLGMFPLLSDQLLKLKAWHAAISTDLPIIIAQDLLRNSLRDSCSARFLRK